MADKRQVCFVISPIGPDGSEIRKRADQVFRHVISPAAAEKGFESIRADQISEPGLITTQVIQHIIEDPLVIADLTGSNPNVFYELAIRHAIRKPLVQIIQKDEKIPFDVAGMRTVPVDHRDLDSVEEAKAEIGRQITSVLRRKPDEIESPISVSVELQALRQSDNPEERSLAEFVSALAELRTDMASIQKRLSNPEAILPPPYLQRLIESSTIRSREGEYLLLDLSARLERVAEELETGKKTGKDVSLEIARLREYLTMLRYDYRTTRRGTIDFTPVS